jgi:hypothetical protein
MTSMCMVMNMGALCAGPWQVHRMWKHLCASAIVLVEPAQDREGEDLPACGIWLQWLRWELWSLLLDALPAAWLA